MGHTNIRTISSLLTKRAKNSPKSLMTCSNSRTLSGAVEPFLNLGTFPAWWSIYHYNIQCFYLRNKKGGQFQFQFQCFDHGSCCTVINFAEVWLIKLGTN